jgi:hypothetical protein
VSSRSFGEYKKPEFFSTSESATSDEFVIRWPSAENSSLSNPPKIKNIDQLPDGNINIDYANYVQRYDEANRRQHIDSSFTDDEFMKIKSKRKTIHSDRKE